MATLVAQEFISQGNWLNKHDAAKLLGISTHTLKTYRKKHWTAQIHFQYLNSRAIRYHEGLIRDWIANRPYPKAHQRAITFYLASLLSNQKKKRGRKPQ
jgi:predicted transcriptional regulator